MNKPGGGKTDIATLNSLEEKVIFIIGKTAVDGVLGGVDSGVAWQTSACTLYKYTYV